MNSVLHPDNFRDVGEMLAILMTESPVRPGMLLRGGRFDSMMSAKNIGGARRVINLRRGVDPQLDGVEQVHIPKENDLEVYETRTPRVRRWVREVLLELAREGASWPTYLHCTAGRDRTGVVVAALLLELGIPNSVIVEEFLVSDGVDASLVEEAVRGLREMERVFSASELSRLSRVLG